MNNYSSKLLMKMLYFYLFTISLTLVSSIDCPPHPFWSLDFLNVSSFPQTSLKAQYSYDFCGIKEGITVIDLTLKAMTPAAVKGIHLTW